MTPYKNLGGKSGVEAYVFDEKSIHVRFKSGSVRNYLYNEVKPGLHTVQIMKDLAQQGKGLNTYKLLSRFRGLFSFFSDPTPLLHLALKLFFMLGRPFVQIVKTNGSIAKDH